MALSEPVGQRVSDTECLTFVFWYPILFAVTLLYVCSCFVLSIFVDIYVFVSYPYFFCICLLVFADGSSCSAPLTSLVGRNSPIRSAQDPSNGSKNKKIRQGKNKKEEKKSAERNVSNKIRSLNFSSIPSILQIDQNISLQIPPGEVLLVSLSKPKLRFLKVDPGENMSFSATEWGSVILSVEYTSSVNHLVAHYDFLPVCSQTFGVSKHTMHGTHIAIINAWVKQKLRSSHTYGFI